MVLGERLELSLPKELAPKASASAISPSERTGILTELKAKMQVTKRHFAKYSRKLLTKPKVEVNLAYYLRGVDEMNYQFSIDAYKKEQYLRNA